MGLLKVMTNYAEYNLWANKKLTDWLLPKPNELLVMEVPSSYSSIIKTITHMLATEEYWFSVIAETPDFVSRELDNFDAEQIFADLIKSSTRLAELIKSFSEDELAKKVLIKNPWFECDLPKHEYLIQAVNHATYHRGQVVTIGRNVGITDASNTDYNFFNVVNIQPGITI
jgi:uncharacterized damage-inducible protein DinB